MLELFIIFAHRNMKNLAEEIETLFSVEGHADIPGIGVLKSSRIPARWNELSKTFIPPCNEIVFIPSGNGLSILPVAAVLAKKSGMSIPDAVRETEKQISDFLHSGEPIKIGEWGTLIPPSARVDDVCKFVPADQPAALPRFYCLPDISLETRTKDKFSEAADGIGPVDDTNAGIRKRRILKRRGVAGFVPATVAALIAAVLMIFVFPPRKMYGVYISSDGAQTAVNALQEPSWNDKYHPSAKENTADTGNRSGIWRVIPAAAPVATKNHIKATEKTKNDSLFRNEWTLVVAGHISRKGAGRLKEYLCRTLKGKYGRDDIRIEKSGPYLFVTVGRFKTRDVAVDALPALRSIPELSESWATSSKIFLQDRERTAS